MNKKLFILTSTLLKNSISFSADAKKRNKQIILFIFVAVCFIPTVYAIVKFISDTFEALVSVGEEGSLLSLGIALSAFIIFFFGIFYSMNTFYFSEDVENLLPLPLKPSQILGAKFFIVAIYEYMTGALILLPILIVYGVKSGGGILYWLYSVLVFLSLPIIPIALASLLVMLIMRFTNVAKNKDRFRMISAVIGILFGVGINILIQKMAIGQGTQQIQFGNNSLVSTASYFFPTAKFGALGLINSANLAGLGYIILFLGLSFVVFWIFSLVGDLLYYKGVTGVSVASSSKKKLSASQLEKQVVQSPVVKTYVLKELRILFRTPSYFINCIIMNFLWPVFLLIPFVTRSKAMSGLGQFSDILQKPDVAAYLLVIAFGVILFVSGTNAIAATSISREGDNIFVNKYIPLSYKTQILAKIIAGVIMSSVGMFSISIAAVLLLKIPLYMFLLIIITSFIGILFSSFGGIIIDLYNPKLHWDNEQKAVKQNFNVVYSMLVNIVFGGLAIFLTFYFKLGLLEVFVGLIILYGVLDLMLYKYLMKKGCEIFSRIEY